MKFSYPISGTSPLVPDMIEAASHSNGFILEIGIQGGYGSTLAFREGLSEHPSPLHISVDWEDGLQTEYRPTETWWHFVIGDSRSPDTLAEVRSLTDRTPGVIFIDTDHNYAQMKAELELWGTIANEDTVWLFHDTWMFGPLNVDMVRAITEYANAHGWTYEDLRTDSHGLGRMRKD